MVKVAAIAAWIAGFGFGIPGLYGFWHFQKTRTIAIFMGFPTYGNGPFERIGIHTSLPLLAGFLFVCVLECITGWGLWQGEKGSAILSLAIIPAELLFYIGFALPFGPPFMVIRTILVLLVWSVLH